MSVATALRYDEQALLDTAVRTYSSIRAESNAHLSDLLDDAGYSRLSADVQRCCSEFQTLRCANGHTFKPIPTYRCNYRLCANCARERQRRTNARLMPTLKAYQRRYRFDRPILLTLTVESSHEPLAVHDKRFKAWFRRLRRSEKWKHYIRAAVAGFEFTYSPASGWHYHVHILAFRKTTKHYRQEELLEQWTKITNGAGRCGVNIQSKGNMRTMADEVLKYVSKPSNQRSWTSEQVREFNQLRRVKFSECYGALRGFKLDDDDDPRAGLVLDDDEHEHLTAGSPCPCCAEPLRYQIVPRGVLQIGAELVRHASTNGHSPPLIN